MLDLIKRLEEATGPCRELDARLLLWEHPSLGSYPWMQTSIGKWIRKDGNASIVSAPNVTSSIDAAVALAERVLPGWGFKLTMGEGYRHAQAVMHRSHPTNKQVVAEHDVLPLALCIAILKAREASDANK